ncbi:IS1 related protein (plasmid) [Deinococcus geothermalis DSM 11300]|uniref:IS1 related protein n=1 Tax=Deinococcus geothermalis (strain DSM 11300 / CIP 105573 / AG-3a) TaxID=319795 RepID=A8ZRN2_DEIGD|nr:IS1 related protein [Deinococcus geothermalis DSM 11300]
MTLGAAQAFPYHDEVKRLPLVGRHVKLPKPARCSVRFNLGWTSMSGAPGIPVNFFPTTRSAVGVDVEHGPSRSRQTVSSSTTPGP